MLAYQSQYKTTHGHTSYSVHMCTPSWRRGWLIYSCPGMTRSICSWCDQESDTIEGVVRMDTMRVASSSSTIAVVSAAGVVEGGQTVGWVVNIAKQDCWPDQSHVLEICI